MRSDLPTGTVTFLFTDVEGSTLLLHELGDEAYADALAEHRGLIRAACVAEGGVEVDTQGDAFFFAFSTASGALAAAFAATEALASGPIRVRAGVHTGAPLVTDEGYVGTDVHRAARIAAAGHGGQVLVAASTASLVDAGFADLGEHRFKDLSAPERIFQLGDESFPPLKTLYRTNLPVPQTPFLGREKELGEVIALLAQEDVRLLTLTGPGGTGKTRLAAQTAGALADEYPDGVFWVPLSVIREPELVLEAAAKAVGSLNGFVSHVRDKRLLLLLDNFEQVVDAATDVSAVLGECPNVDVLVTSRELLRLRGEHEYAVPPFAEEEGVGFFAARARFLRPDFEADDTVREICRQLDGLPLALELAAARLTALSTSQILERLEQRLPLLTGGARDAPERQRTLHATIEWSHELLSTHEQELFARLSVFSGGCIFEAAEVVCGADLDMLQSLVEKSLLRFTDERYWMLETIREYASEQLDSSAEANDLEARHAAWYRDLSEQSEPQLMGPSGARWILRLEAEIANIRKAVVWGIANDRQLALAIVANTGYFWPQTGRAAEGRRLLEAGWMDDVPASLKIRAVRALSGVALSQNDLETVERLSRERLELARELGDPTHEGAAMGMLANALADRGETDAAREWYEAAIAFDREHSRTSPSLGNLGRMERDVGNLARSRQLLEENLAESIATGNEVDVAWVKKELAGTATEQGALAEACAHLIEGFEMCKRLGLTQTERDHVFGTAMLASRVSHPEAAAVLLGGVAAEGERDGFEILPTTVWWWALRERLVAQLGKQEFERFMGEGRFLDHEQAVARARVLLDEVRDSLHA